MVANNFKLLSWLLLFSVALRNGFAEDARQVLIEPRGNIVDYSTASMCPYDCQPELCRPVSTCPSGAQPQYDGCRCCQACPRGQGDSCDYRNPCSDTLQCIYIDGTGSRGICRSNKTCRLASGKVLQDGEAFQPHCSMQCSCQGGLVGCASLCQQADERHMAFAMKGSCQRVRVPNNCCPQWICDHALLSSMFFRKGMIDTSPEPAAVTTSPEDSKKEEEKKPDVSESSSNTEKVAVERASPLIILQANPPSKQHQVRTSRMRSIDTPAAEYRPKNCSGTPILLRSCAVNKCGLRLTDDFVSNGSRCPKDLMPTSAYCMLKPCAKKRRQHTCQADSPPLAEMQVKVRHSGCRPKTVAVHYCRSCKTTVNRCCIPAGHHLVAYNQSCYDGSMRTFYVAQVTACSCRSDVFRPRDCQVLYQKTIEAAMPPLAQVYEQENEDDQTD